MKKCMDDYIVIIRDAVKYSELLGKTIKSIEDIDCSYSIVKLFKFTDDTNYIISYLNPYYGENSNIREELTLQEVMEKTEEDKLEEIRLEKEHKLESLKDSKKYMENKILKINDEISKLEVANKKRKK